MAPHRVCSARRPQAHGSARICKRRANLHRRTIRFVAICFTDQMPISPARTIAFDALLRVETEAAYASEILHARLNAKMDEDVPTKAAKLSPRDAALATEIVMGALRWQRL